MVEVEVVVVVQPLSRYHNNFCRSYGAFLGGREKASTRVLKTEGRGKSSTLFFLSVGQWAGPYTIPPAPSIG